MDSHQLNMMHAEHSMRGYEAPRCDYPVHLMTRRSFGRDSMEITSTRGTAPCALRVGGRSGMPNNGRF
jgi:hypothetical protein